MNDHMIEELRTAAEACLEDQPPDPNAVELAHLVLAALDHEDSPDSI